MGRMTRLIDYGAWASSRSDPSKRRTWPLRRAGWRFDRASGAWDGPDGERLTVSFLGFAILEREDADWEHPGTGYGTQWHGGRYGMPYARRVDGDWRPRVAVMLARNAVKVQDLMLSRPLTAVSAADARRLLVRCRRAADLYPPDDPDLFRRLMDGLEERTTRIGSYAMVEYRRGSPARSSPWRAACSPRSARSSSDPIRRGWRASPRSPPDSPAPDCPR